MDDSNGENYTTALFAVCTTRIYIIHLNHQRLRKFRGPDKREGKNNNKVLGVETL